MKPGLPDRAAALHWPTASTASCSSRRARPTSATSIPEALKQKVEPNRKQGVALDCFGIGWEGYNDDLLEVLSRNGDGRYGFVNTPRKRRRSLPASLPARCMSPPRT